MSWLSETAAGVLLQVRVVPRASRTEVAEVMGDALKIRLQAPPVDGKANAALLRYLADVLNVPVRRVVLLAGETGRNKRVRVDGVTAAAVRQVLAPGAG